MADDQQTLKQFLFDTKSRADLILREDHSVAEVKTFIKHLWKFGSN